MTALLLLIILSALILWAQIRIWKSYKNLLFPVITGVLYFWSLMGAWLFVFDRLTGFGENIGFAYYYLLDKMFQVELDGTYSLVILSYGAFILLFQLFSYLGIRFIQKKFPIHEVSQPVETNSFSISQTPILLIAMTAMICSFCLVKDVFISSLLLNESVYSNVRSGYIPNYSLHQYFNWVMVFSFALYLGISYRSNYNIVSAKKPNWIFWSCFVLMIIYLSAIGSRHELFLGGLFMILFISYPHRSVRKNKRLYLVFFVAFFFILAANDPMRGMTSVLFQKLGLTSLVNTKSNREMAIVYAKDRTFFLHQDIEQSNTQIETSKMKDTVLVLKNDTIVMKLHDFSDQILEHPDWVLFEGKKYKINNKYVSFGYQKMNAGEKFVKAVTNVLFSNELFAGHFSLYGIYSHKVKPSMITLRHILGKENRNTYEYYVDELKLPKDQGFTINHISSWYLNFGFIGFVIGALFLAICYLLPLYLFYWLLKRKKQLLFILIVLVGMTAYMPLIIRSDLLVFEGLFKQVVIVPALILLAVRIYYYLFQSKKRKHVG